ncbi:hypothetical protein [Streptomyces indicus]|uniref:Uncharacterized protein n=1 Tax=Streptomyces indicus TaxID=417292 RepID=A0A1G9GWA5_9ACTN|nr:hypothetical protein [Streptomyces indicus]SDL04946.1 hypothetical protein SAMN05421806_11754 [Streptomyces indicus]
MPAAASARAQAFMGAARTTAMAALAVLLVVVGVWTSWADAQHVLFTKGRERGTLTVTRCEDNRCEGRFEPLSPGARARAKVTIEESIGTEKGAKLPVVVKPGSSQVVRGAGAGFFHAWLPLGGALLMAAVVVGGGLRLTRVAWGVACAGTLLLFAAFVLG